MKSHVIIDRAAPDYLVKLGGPEFLDRMIEIFCAHPLQLLSEARIALTAGQVETVRRAGHSLKNCAAQIGAVRLREVALQLEQAPLDASPRQLNELLDALSLAYVEACEGVRAYRRSLAP